MRPWPPWGGRIWQNVQDFNYDFDNKSKFRKAKLQLSSKLQLFEPGLTETRRESLRSAGSPCVSLSVQVRYSASLCLLVSVHDCSHVPDTYEQPCTGTEKRRDGRETRARKTRSPGLQPGTLKACPLGDLLGICIGPFVLD